MLRSVRRWRRSPNKWAWLRLSTDYRVSFPAASASAWRWRAAWCAQPLLLLDEPFSALDPALRQEMLSLVEEVCEREQLTMLMVSHSIEDAARIAPRSVVIAEGRILWDGTTDALMSGKESASGLLGIRP